MKPLTFTAQIVQDGAIKKLKMNNGDYFQTRIQKSPCGPYSVTVSDGKPKRSNQQNRFLFGAYYPLIAEETGEDDINRLHALFKKKFIPDEYKTVLGEEVLLDKTTTTMTKGEFSDFIRKIETLTNILAPDPADVGMWTDKGEIQKPADIPYPESDNKTAF